MTNEERQALIAQGWTPPLEPVDPDLAEAEDLHEAYIDNKYSPAEKAFYHAIKRGRELERAEAKPGMVWKKWDGCNKPPMGGNTLVMVRFGFGAAVLRYSSENMWPNVTHYAEITQPEEK